MRQGQTVEKAEMAFRPQSQVLLSPAQEGAEDVLTVQVQPVLEVQAEAVQGPLAMGIKAQPLEPQTQAEAEGVQPVGVQETLGPEVPVLSFSLFQQEQVCRSLVGLLNQVQQLGITRFIR